MSRNERLNGPSDFKLPMTFLYTTVTQRHNEAQLPIRVPRNRCYVGLLIVHSFD